LLTDQGFSSGFISSFDISLLKGKAAGFVICFFRHLWLSMEHHDRVSISAPPRSKVGLSGLGLVL